MAGCAFVAGFSGTEAHPKAMKVKQIIRICLNNCMVKIYHKVTQGSHCDPLMPAKAKTKAEDVVEVPPEETAVKPIQSLKDPSDIPDHELI